jgi:iron complex outermembrane receptor protein
MRSLLRQTPPPRPRFQRRLLTTLIGLGFGPAAFAQTAADAASPAGTVLPAVSATASAETGDSPLQQLNKKIEGGALGGRSQLETPFSTTIVTRTELEERPVDRLGDIFALDASVSDNSAAYGAWSTYLTVRGLPLDWQNGFRLDGNPFLSYSTPMPLEHLEQVELLKGSQGFLYGFGSPGGVVNYITRKPPQAETVRNITVGYGGGGTWLGHLDLGGRGGVDGMFGYRLNVTREQGDTINDGSLERNALSLALDARLTKDLSWDFQTMLQNRENTGTEPTILTSSYTSAKLPSPVSGDDENIVGAGSMVDNRLRHFATGLKYTLSPDWSVSARYSHSMSETRRNETILQLQDSTGAYQDYRSDYAEHYQFNNIQAMVDGAFKTGAVGHRLVAGVSSQANKNDYANDGFYGNVGTGNLYQPNTNSYYSNGALTLARGAEIRQDALFASDTLKFSDAWSAIVGARFIRYEEEVTGYDKDVVTPTVALMYKTSPRTMIYGSYVEALEPGSVVGSTYANRGEVLKPVESRQFEFGVKTDQDDWSATAAVFRIERKNGAEYTTGTAPTLTLIRSGEAIYQGAEVAASKRFGSGLEAGGSLMVLDTEYGQDYPDQGKRVAGSPNAVAAIYASYRLPSLPGLKLRADAKYTGDTPLRGNNTLEVSSFTVANFGAIYDSRIGGNDLTYRFTVRNVFDKQYWMYQYANYVKAGDPRTFGVSASLNF